MGSLNTVEVCFILLFVVPSAISCTEAFSGSCYRINYKAGNCGKFLRSAISKSSCCNGNYRRAWSPYKSQREWPLLLRSNQTVLEEQDNKIHHNQGCYPCYTSCQDIKCDEDEKCIIKNGLPKCVCNPKCHLQHKSTVCGTDGRTYSSECHLLKRSCRKKQRLSIVHSGACQTCSGIRCGTKKTCVLDQLLTPKCIKCPKKCHVNRKSICGTDNVTYQSRCFMKMASCEAGATIRRAYKGPCKKDASCNQVSCRSDETCLTDPITNQPRCSWCGNNKKCEVTQREMLICASDGSFYQSLCAFEHSSCRSMKALIVYPLEFCKKNVTKTEKKQDCKDHNKHRKRKSRRKQRKESKRHNSLITQMNNEATVPGHLARITQNSRSEMFKKKLNRNLQNRKKKRKRKDCLV